MNILVAKPIVKDQYWVVTDGNQKVGNVIASGSGYNVKINGVVKHFGNSTQLKKESKIQFQSLKTNKTKLELPFSHYPTTKRVYNSVLDIKRKLHLFTKTAKSKCYYAAGWFLINQNNSQEVVFCPKYIFIQRYSCQGPFKSEIDAKNMINNS